MPSGRAPSVPCSGTTCEVVPAEVDERTREEAAARARTAPLRRALGPWGSFAPNTAPPAKTCQGLSGCNRSTLSVSFDLHGTLLAPKRPEASRRAAATIEALNAAGRPDIAEFLKRNLGSIARFLTRVRAEYMLRSGSPSSDPPHSLHCLWPVANAAALRVVVDFGAPFGSAP